MTASEATLPAVYSEARNALAKCARIDECKSWADRAAALASYAKQADDEQLLNNAKRIKARAIDRIGELAEEIPPAKNQHDAADRAITGAGSSRNQIARILQTNHVGSFSFSLRGENSPVLIGLFREIFIDWRISPTSVFAIPLLCTDRRGICRSSILAALLLIACRRGICRSRRQIPAHGPVINPQHISNCAIGKTLGILPVAGSLPRVRD